VAVGECMTYSMGFKAQSPEALAQELLPRMADLQTLEASTLYRDPHQVATLHPARIPEQLQAFAHQSLKKILLQKQASQLALGECLSEPKAQVWFEAQPNQDISAGVVLDRKTKMLYDDRCMYINGESWRCAGADAKALRQLADKKFLSPKQIQTASTVLSELLQNWLQAGWLHVMGAEK